MNEPAAQPNPPLSSDDPDALVKALDLQIALRRAKRLSGDGGNRRQAHLAGVFFILLIVFAALGALWHLKSTMPEPPTHRPSNPAPATSARPVH